MFKRMKHIFLLSAAILCAVSCLEKEEVVQGPVNDAIVLKLSNTGTKTVESSQTESYVHHLDVFIFQADADNAKGKRVHYKRYELNNSSSLTLECKRTEFSPEDRFYVYLVANASFSEEELAAQETYYELQHNRQVDDYIHHCGLTSPNAPHYFLMDALATNERGENPVRLNDGVLANSTLLTAELRRAAAKVEITIKAGKNVTFHNFAGDLESEGGLYHIRNLPCDAFILSGEEIYKESAKLRNTMKGTSAYFGWRPETDAQTVTLVAYVYPHTWKDASLLDYETCVVVNLPMIYNKGKEDEVEYKNSWFKIPMTNTSSFERNHYYGVNITLNRPGAAADANPQTVDHIYYAVEEWTEKRVPVGGTTGPQYLQLNTDHLELYNKNIDATTLEFASSSYIPADGIELVEAYYYNYLDQRVDLSKEDKYGIYGAIMASAQQGVLNGRITVNSPFVAMSRAEMDEAIAALKVPVPVPEPPGMPEEVENPDNDATLDAIADKYSGSGWFSGTVTWRREGDNVIFSGSGWGADAAGAQSEYDQLKAAYDRYLEALEKFVADYPDYMKYLQEKKAYDDAVAAIESMDEDVHGNAIRYLRFRVTNQTGQTVEFSVVQSPTIYIDNEMGHFSYRSDFGGTNYNTKGNPNRAGATWGNNGWTYSETSSNNSFFGSKVAQTSGSSYTINYYYYNNRGRQIGSAISSLNNPRMYHVHVTATSALYTVSIPKRDVNGYTESTPENSKLVSPSFMIASQLGATLSPSNKTVAETHCAEYIEVTNDGRTFDDWRLPTASEIDIIISHQDVSDAMAVVLTGANYYCAYNTDSRGNVIYTKATGKSGSGVAVRCVRDVY